MLGAQMIGFSRVSRLSRVRVSVRIKVRFGFSGANMNRKKRWVVNFNSIALSGNYAGRNPVYTWGIVLCHPLTCWLHRRRSHGVLTGGPVMDPYKNLVVGVLIINY